MTDSRTGTTSFEYYDNGQVREITAPDPDGAGPLSALVTTMEYDNYDPANLQLKTETVSGLLSSPAVLTC